MVVTKFKIPSRLLPLSTTICCCTPWYWATCMFEKVMDKWKWTWWKLWPSKLPIHLTFATSLWLYKVHLLNNSYLSLNHGVVICMNVWKWMWRCNFGTMAWKLLKKLNFDYNITTIEQESVLYFHEHGIPSFKKIWKCFVTKDQGLPQWLKHESKPSQVPLALPSPTFCYFVFCHFFSTCVV